MVEVAAAILETEDGRILLMLRDDKPDIPFPNHWDIIGGQVEKGETPEQAVIREVKEETGYELKDFAFFKKYVCTEGDVRPNTKYIYTAKLHAELKDLILGEGQEQRLVPYAEIPTYTFANIMGSIVMDYLNTYGKHT